MAKKIVDTSKFEYKDLFDRDIKVGDYITYAAVDGRSGTLRVGLVIELTYSKTSYTASDPEPKIRCRSWSNFRSERKAWGRPDPTKGQTGRQKDVTLAFMDRMLVLDPSLVTDEIKKDLDGPIGDYMGSYDLPT